MITSNIGSELLTTLSFGKNLEDNHSDIILEFGKVFKPGFLNILYDIVLFNIIEEIMMEDMTKVHREPIRKKLLLCDLTVDISDDVIIYLAKLGYDYSFGARHLKKRALQKESHNLIAYATLRGNLNSLLNIQFRIYKNSINLNLKIKFY